jgi:UDP-glucose 4-epimerase
MQKILVTGGAGYIGSHICKKLHEMGFDPIVFDNLSTGNIQNIQWGAFHKGDLANISDLESVFINNKIESVIHTAGRTFPRESMSKASEYYSSNVTGTVNLLDMMKKFNVKNIIFSSSCSTYCTQITEPITEIDKQEPTTPYANTKFIVEKILKDYYEAYGICSISFRFFNAAGANNDLSIGENIVNQDRIIPLIFNSILNDASPLQLYGDNHPTHDGTSIRDYIHVDDLADAHIIGMNKLRSREIQFDYFNLGSGSGHSLLELIHACKIITKKDIPYVFKNAYKIESSKLVANINKANTTLNWTPTKSDINSIIDSAWNWFLKQTKTS